MSIKFDPAVQYGNYTLIKTGTSDQEADSVRANLQKDVESFIPIGYRRSVKWISIQPEAGRPGSIAWKYTPARKVAT